MEQLIQRLKDEITGLKADLVGSTHQVTQSVIGAAIEMRERQIMELINHKMEVVELSCKEEDGGAFELAITQLGYRITDSTWDDEAEKMYYTAEKMK